MMIKTIRSVLWGGLALFVAGVIGCTAPGSQATATNSISPTNTRVAASQTRTTASPTVTRALQTPTATLPPTLTATSTWTPWPQLSEEEGLAAFLDIYENNGGCELPCVWGITPGQTTLEEVHERFTPFADLFMGSELYSLPRYILRVFVPEDVRPIGVFVLNLTINDNNVINSITTGVEDISPDFDYSISGLLETFGVPKEIWVGAKHQGEPGSNWYKLYLVYPEAGVSIDKEGIVSSYSENTATICLDIQDVGTPGLSIWVPEEMGDIVVPALIEEIRSLGGSPLEARTDMNTQTFYETYVIAVANPCFKYYFP